MTKSDPSIDLLQHTTAHVGLGKMNKATTIQNVGAQVKGT